MARTTAVVCDQCGERCGGPEHFWWFYTISPEMDGLSEYLKPMAGGDFCSAECMIAHLESHRCPPK